MNATLTLAQAADLLEERQAKVHIKPVNLANLEPLPNGRLGVTGDAELDGLYLHPDDEHPMKQLCGAISMSHGFYKSNPEALNSKIFETRFRGMAEENASRLVRYRETGDGQRVLAFLPSAFEGPSYASTVRALANHVPGDAVVRIGNFHNLDDQHRLHLRVSFPALEKPVAVGDPVQIGLLTDISEDGIGTRGRVETYLERLVCLNGAVASYNGKPLLETNYRGASFIINEALNAVFKRFGDDLDALTARCSEAAGKTLSVTEALQYLMDLEKRRDLSITFLRRVRREVRALATVADTDPDTTQISHWDVVNSITELAQRLPVTQRINHEIAAGRLLGLDLAA